ncbi:hypothetical protein [Archaeoglobus profundus]|uniref:RsbT co-antagonist protein RsbRD N-terminal domain-containing protein n=1 Tax=Archaeoglobus profundus (strain DSM 5631 / JCM 9629 / NBRC 100127 / Av18) TaxID=572546 RepID=D2RI72_ARCPA|nr:hypothetical protein [Archaeoglobus profundus]ADB57997.1 hypothetical protein Arcpr_0936 [Archaeoglobus profundus DSM 5631]
MLKELEKKKDDIAKEFRELFLKRYPIRPPVEIVDFLDECAKGIVYAIAENNYKDLDSSLDYLMRYLATDSRLSAGGSIGTLFYLREIVLNKINLNKDELLELDRRLSVVICKAFDLYMNAREELYKAKYKQMEFELKAQMKQFEFCMKHCPFLERGFDKPPEGIQKISAKDSEKHGDVDNS